MTPETVTLEYIEIDAATMAVPEQADEQTLRDRYENELARFGTPEQRLASHILVRADGEDADAQRAALERATGLAAQARADDADFAELAREHSADLGSRSQGGDLGWVDRGQTDPAFEDALFALEAGAVSDPVRTDEGYHVIMLRELRPATQQPFEEVREQLAGEFQASERERLFAERSGEMIDLIYEDPGSLRPAAEALGLEIRSAGPFRRDSFDGLFESDLVREAAFSDEVLLEGQVSEAIDVSPTRRVAIRMTEHARSEPRPLDDVAGEIDGRIVAERRADAVRAHAEALMARLQGGEALADIASAIGAEVEQGQQVGRSAAAPEQQLVAEVFRMPRPAGDVPQRRLVALGAGHALVELSRVADGDPAAVPEARREQVRTELEQARALAESRALIASLRATAEIQVAEDRMM
jgi:peptidyl-prolyl cis-trans isomerase D